ncbi:CHAT domain-containing protein [Leptolyngbya cf. ectocarpi LEGE 11479]|uniref:CHAT domain-containing protein n=2 Tax=Leptolyngbya ectocarpi TaxID=1202 RepID=A0A928X0N9_LEPEC|nr:CHAT domain-containing protein [Leptolyngbya cf. ectocarpi LEGE 11479]
MTASMSSSSESLCLWLALDRLTAADPEHYAIWVLKSPYPGGHVHHDRIWNHTLSQAWQTWQSMFSLRGLPQVPHVPSAYVPQLLLDDTGDASTAQSNSYSSRLMQHLGLNLWQWLFDGPVQSSLDHSCGIAQGQNTVMRLRLEVRDPELISVPWEIMQAQPGRPAVALNQQILFSRTTSDVDPLSDWGLDNGLRILLVVGHDDGASDDRAAATLSLDNEASLLKSILESRGDSRPGRRVVRQVDVLLQPSPAELIQHLERYRYNLFFYAGHGVPAPDGGLLFLQREATLNGTELAQVLTRCRVKLAVFNTCWGAQPERSGQQAIPRSSLAEVLLHHGVPAVLAMRDSIADEEALSFIQIFAQALAERKPVDEAVAIARQHLLTLYKFNQPAWTLPVLYMHPDFDGELLTPMPTDITRLPGDSGIGGRAAAHTISIREIGGDGKVWPIYRGLMRVGRLPDNDLVIAEPWVSSKHAEIFYRRVSAQKSEEPTYFLRDFSRYGTYYLGDQGWQQIHRQEIAIASGTQLRFGSSDGCLLEFIIEPTAPA